MENQLPTVLCPYCNQPAQLVSSTEVYRRDYGPIFLCRPCEAWVGCHDGSFRPLGRLANAELREWKMKAHAAFDPIWQNLCDAEVRRVGPYRGIKHIIRNEAYRRLAERLGIKVGQCHIGEFDVETCRRVVNICQQGLEVPLEHLRSKRGRRLLLPNNEQNKDRW